MTRYNRGERVPKLGVYHFTMAEPDEDSELLLEDSDEEQPDVAVKKPVCNCSFKRLCQALIVIVLVTIIIVLSVILTMGVMMPLESHSAFPAKPPMGWTSVRLDGDPCGAIHWTSIIQVVQMLETKHLRDKGYKFIVIDGCWQESRNSSGYLQPTSSLGSFKGLVGHARWLRQQEKFKVGISTGVGSQTCHNKPGSYSHEKSDLKVFTKFWRAEYISADSCLLPAESNQSVPYRTLYNAINRKNNKVILHMNATVPLSAARLSGHIRQVVPWTMLDDWGDMMAIVDKVIEDKLWLYAKPGFWNDLGPLTIGMGGMTPNEQESQFALWCIFKSQLFLTTTHSHINETAMKLVANKDLIDINQDELGESASLVHEYNATTRYSEFQVVAKACSEDDKNQLWRFDNASYTMVHRMTGKCLAHNVDKYVSVDLCSSLPKQIQWHLKSAKPPDEPTDHQVMSTVKSNECLTLSTHKGVPAKIRPCNERVSTRNWQGKNQAWHGFNDAFELIKHNDYIQLRNKAGMCLSVGGVADKQIFAGRLSKQRHIVLLLNRASHHHPIHLQFKHISNIDLSKEHEIHDVISNTSQGKQKDGFETIVNGRSVKVFILKQVDDD